MEIIKATITYTKYDPETHEIVMEKKGDKDVPVKVQVKDCRKIKLTTTDITINPSTLRTLAEEQWTAEQIIAACSSGFVVAQDARKRNELEKASGKVTAPREPGKAKAPVLSEAEADMVAKLAASQDPAVQAVLAILRAKQLIK